MYVTCHITRLQSCCEIYWIIYKFLCFNNIITLLCCLTGLHLLISKQAAVSDNVTLTIKWLLHPFQGNLTCTLNAGDGHTIDPYMPEK